MKISELTQPKHRNKLGAIVIIVAILGFYLTGGFRMAGVDVDRPVTNYGSWYLYEDASGDAINSGDIISKDNGIKVTFILDSQDYKPDTLDCKLYKTGTPASMIETGEGGWQTTAYIWHFDLSATATGTFTYFIRFWGTDGDYFVSGDTYTFQIENTESSVYDDPEILEKPADVSFNLMQSPATVSWKYKTFGATVGSSLLTISVNGDIVETDRSNYNGYEYIYIYDVDTSIDGTQNIVFTITPDDPSNQAVSDSVQVIVELASATLDDPVIRDGLEDQDALIGASMVLSWNYTFEGSAMLNLYIDNVLEDSVAYAGSTIEQAYTYSFIPVAEVDYVIKFEVYPDSSENILVTDIVVISGKTTITTTTTTTTTTPPVEPGLDYMLLAIGAAVVVIVGFVILKKRSEY